ncbi:MAG: TIGR03086 family metal-binding protein [Acidimicrobiales bacterium]
MDPLDALALATSEMQRRLDAVAGDQWTADTPCDGWDVTDIVRHVVGGNRMAVALLGGCTRDDAMALLAGVDLGDDPVAAFRDAAGAQLAAFAEPGAFERLCHHPMGDMPGEQIIGFRTGDLTMHGWDIARATGADEAIPLALVEVVWESLQPVAPFIGQIGLFGGGPSGDVGEDAPLQDRMLDLAGRTI